MREKRALRWAALMSAALLLVAPCVQLASGGPPQATAVVQVQVLDAETLRPIPHAALQWGVARAYRKGEVRSPQGGYLAAGPDGVAKLTVPRGIRFLTFHTNDPNLVECGYPSLPDLDDLRAGQVPVDVCDPEAPVRAGLKPTPGRVIIFATPACCVAWPAPHPEIRVLVLNGISGKPMRHLQVTFLYSGNAPSWDTSGVTDDEGVLRVTLRRPIARVFDAGPSKGLDYPGCSYGTAMTNLVLTKGFVQRPSQGCCRSKGKWSVPRPKPGEFIVFVRHRHFWEYFFL